MTKGEMMTQYVLEHYGHLTLSEIQKMGISKTYAMEYICKLRMLSIQMEDIRKTLIEISQIDIDDGVVFEFQSAERIMEHICISLQHTIRQRISFNPI